MVTLPTALLRRSRAPLAVLLGGVLLAMPAASQSNRRLTIHDHAITGDHEYVGRLIEYGKNPDLPSSRWDGRRPLHLGAAYGRLEVVKVLLEAKVTVDPLDDAGWTPLHLAAWGGNAEIVQVLLDAGASKRTAGYRGETALHLAAENGSYKATKCLLPFRGQAPSVNEHGWTSLHKAAAFGHRDCLEVLVAREDDLDRQTSCGFTAMHLAARRDDTELIDVLLKAGADPALRDQLGRTPAELYAAWRGRRVSRRREAPGEDEGAADSRPAPGALLQTSEEPPYLLAHYRGGGPGVDGKDHSALDVALWTDGVIAFCSNPEEVGVDVRVGIATPERIAFLWRELEDNGVLGYDHAISSPGSGCRRFDVRHGERWRGTGFSGPPRSRERLRDGLLIHSWQLGGVALESLIPVESWGLEQLLDDDGRYRGFDPEQQGRSLRTWRDRRRR